MVGSAREGSAQRVALSKGTTGVKGSGGRSEVEKHELGIVRQGAGSQRSGGDDGLVGFLARTIEAEIIPRLMLAHRTSFGPLDEPSDRDELPEMLELSEFARIVMCHEVMDANRYVERLRGQGYPLQTIYLKLIAPTARRLGEMWSADLCDFTQVTVGLWRLQQVLHHLSLSFRGECESSIRGRRILLMPVPGEQHTLGLFMVDEFFRRAGWDVCGELPSSRSELLDLIRTEWFDIAGISIGSVARVDAASSVVLALRGASLNRQLSIMVGGPLILAHPEFVENIGADSMASDAEQAVLAAEKMVALQVLR
jgi:methanogenic corrinoid protein MtbC1